MEWKKGKKWGQKAKIIEDICIENLENSIELTFNTVSALMDSRQKQM